MVRPICWMMTGASPSVGSSSSRSRAPVRRMRPIASICCSPPESLVPWLDSRSLQVGEQLEDPVETSPPGRTCGGSSRFSLTSRLEKMPRSSGQKAMPGARDRVRGAADQLVAFEAHRAGAVVDDAHDGFERRGLAGAVAAEQRDHLARLHVESRRRAGCGIRRTRLPARSRQAARCGSGMAGPEIGFAHGRIGGSVRSRPRPAPGRASAR